MLTVLAPTNTWENWIYLNFVVNWITIHCNTAQSVR